MVVRSLNVDSRDNATLAPPSAPTGIAFKCRGKVAPGTVRESLVGWGIEPIGGLPGWFEAHPPPTMPLDTFWDTLRRLRTVGSVTSAEPLYRVVVPEPSGAVGLGQDDLGLWGWPYDHATQTKIQTEREKPDWHLRQMRVPEAWALWKRNHGKREPGDGIVVAHPDTGYTNHHEIVSRWKGPGRSFVGDPDASDTLAASQPEHAGRAGGHDELDTGFLRAPGHGTATASVIASGSREALGDAKEVHGVAPGAKVLPLRVSESVIHFDFDNLGKAILAAVDANADVISMSLGGPFKSDLLRSSIAEAHRHGLIVVSAAGNSLPTVVFPAAFPEVIAVAATHVAGEPWRLSGLGRSVDIAAPGEDVWCARSRLENGAVQYVSDMGTGTSFATACVAGLAALWLSHHGGRAAIAAHYGGKLELVPFAFKYQLTRTADTSREFVRRGRHGAGIANAHRLLEQGLPRIDEVRRFREVVRKQSSHFLSTVTGFFTGWLGVDDEILEPSSISLALDATIGPDNTVRTDPVEETEAVIRANQEYRKETELFRRFLGEDAGAPGDDLSLADELLAQIAADRVMFIGCQRWRPSESLLPLFDRLLVRNPVTPMSPGLRERLIRQREFEEMSQRPLYQGRLVPYVPRVDDSGAHVPTPAYRMLRAYAFDPSQATSLGTAPISQVVIPTRWEALAPGPVGEYLEVVDIDPASGCTYAPVDLDHPHILGQDGLTPSEGDPQFHQQMVYAVAMNTINRFELALGRPIFWAPLRPWFGEMARERHIYTPESLVVGDTPEDRRTRNRDRFVQRLRIYPHALREANAYYSPAKRALLFGYFPGNDEDSGKHYPGGMVFTCLSHDIIVHETSHALMDGMHPFFTQPGRGDSWAFHEAFADIIALFQHFTYPEVLRHQIAATRGNLETNNLLGQLAQQFGQATGNREALRSALGKVENGTWQRSTPDPLALRSRLDPHSRGGILVAAVFDAFLKLYNDRVADLFRLATGGRGIIPDGHIHPDLVNRLALTAADTAEDVLTTCIRALDYLPPVDITFGEFLRALITADYDMGRSGHPTIRVAFIEAFRAWGIYPRDVTTLSEESLLWRGPGREDVFTMLFDPEKTPDPLTDPAGAHRRKVLEDLRPVLASWEPGGRRQELFNQILEAQATIHGVLRALQDENPQRPLLPGLDLRAGARFGVSNLRLARRSGALGEFRNELVVEVVQFHRSEEETAVQAHRPTGGATLVVDLSNWKIRYIIYKRLYRRLPDRSVAGDEGELVTRLQQPATGPSGPVAAGMDAADPDLGSRAQREPFAFLHRGPDALSIE